MSNENHGVDAATSFWLDQGSSEPTVEKVWSEERERVSSDPDRDDWKGRHEEDRRQAVEAAVDEVRGRDNDRSDWDAGREHRDWVRERWPSANLASYIGDKLKWHSAFQQNPLAAEQAWTRMWHREPPFRHQPKAAPEAKPPFPDLDARGRIEWERDQDARNAYLAATREREDEDNFTNTATLRDLVKERTGLTLSQFLEKARMIDEASLENPQGMAYRFATFSGAPVDEQHATEMVSAAQHQQAVGAADTWLGQLEQQGRLPPDYKYLENEVGDVLQFMNANGMRTDNIEQDLDTAIQWARDRHLARAQGQQQRQPQQGGAAERPLSTMDYAIRDVLPEQAAEVERAKVDRARFASRSVSGSPSPGSSPGPDRRSGASYEDDLLADVRDAVRG